MLQKSQHFFPRTDQLSVLTAVIGLGYASSRFLYLPARAIETTLFGSPISVQIDGQMIMLLLLTALITTGTDVLIRSHPCLSQDTLDLRPLCHGIVPGLTALSVGVLLNGLEAGSLWFLGMLAGATVLMLVLVAEYAVIYSDHIVFHKMEIVLTLLTYLTALVLFSLVAQLGVIAAPVTLFMGGLLSFRLLHLHSDPARQVGWNSLAVGLLLAELILVLGYWALPPIAVGACLLVALHFAVNIIQQGIRKSHIGLVVVEYVLVAVIALGLTALLILE